MGVPVEMRVSDGARWLVVERGKCPSLKELTDVQCSRVKCHGDEVARRVGFGGRMRVWRNATAGVECYSCCKWWQRRAQKMVMGMKRIEMVKL